MNSIFFTKHRTPTSQRFSFSTEIEFQIERLFNFLQIPNFKYDKIIANFQSQIQCFFLSHGISKKTFYDVNNFKRTSNQFDFF